MSDAAVRAARAGDARIVAAIVYESAPEVYDRLTGNRERAVALLIAAFDREGTDTSAEVISVAELEGEVAAVLSSFPVREAGRRSAALVRLLLGRTAMRRWPAVIRYIHRSRRTAPMPPAEALYVDALATDPRHRRRGAARALLSSAEAEARSLRLPRIALDTEMSNSNARALYESEGYVATATGRRVSGMPQFVLYVKELAGRERATRPAP